MPEYLIWGGGGHGKVVADAARLAGLHIRGFVDSDSAKEGTLAEPGGGRIIVSEADFLKSVANGDLPDGVDGVILAIGSNSARQRCRLRLPVAFLTTVIHPGAMVSPNAIIGIGSVVLAGAVVNSSARLGSGCIINSGAIVEHDCLVGDDAHVAPRAVLAGGVK
ncbi:MAG: hypothetical protein H0W69_09020, partial [Gemmatimonadaceae bacterium]|nr:hypothetical protein [Gemmatimonadaceae bacterium]